MPRIGPFGRMGRGLLLLAVGAFFFGGCDGSGSKRASLYERLTGTWTIERLQEIESSFDHTPRLNDRYSWVRFDFRAEEGRRYRVTARPTDDTTTVVLGQGAIQLGRDRVIHMVGGFQEPSGTTRVVTWSFSFEASRAILELSPGQRNGALAFLSTLLPGMSWRESQGIRLQLAPKDGA